MNGAGAVAQLVERLRGTQEAGGSSPLSSTLATIGFTLGGIVAGEGSFFVTRKLPPYRDGTPRLLFVFEVSLTTRDRPALEALREFLGRGSITDAPSRHEKWLPVSQFRIASLVRHHAATIPFAEQFLPPCAKREQFDRWKSALYDHEARHPSRFGKGRSTCSEPNCDRPVRGQGLCRSHYYRVTGY